MKTIDIEFFENYFNKEGLINYRCADCLVVPLNEDVSAAFRTQGTKVQLTALSSNERHKRPRAEALELCNKWNQEKIVPKLYLDDDGIFFGEATIVVDGEISEEFVIENFIWSGFKGMLQFIDSLNE